MCFDDERPGLGLSPRLGGDLDRVPGLLCLEGVLIVVRVSWTLLAADIGRLLSVLRIVVVSRGSHDVVPCAGSSDELFSFSGGPGKGRRRHGH